MKTTLSPVALPRSKIEKNSARMSVGVTGTSARSGAVAAAYGVPAASAGDIVATPVDLTVIGLPSLVTAKSWSSFWIAVSIASHCDWPLELGATSAMNASLYGLVRPDG